MSAFRLAAASFGLIACLSSAGAQELPPPPPGDLIYSRIKPCRVFDTTKTAKIPAASAKSFLVSGAGNYAAQGGAANGCGIPASAQAVSINLTAINGAAAGTLTAMPYAQTASTATVRYPVSAPETAGGIVDLLQNKLTLRTTNTVNAIGDVTGYYAPSMWASFLPQGAPAATSRVVQYSRAAVGAYQIYFDRDVRNCVAHATARLNNYNAITNIDTESTSGFVAVLLFDQAGNAVDGYFYLSVIC